MAVNCGVVVFNVDYRISPGVRAPTNILDFVAVVKHVASHAAELGVDPARIAIAGESGGGYIVAGTAVELARYKDFFNCCCFVTLEWSKSLIAGREMLNL